MWVPVGTSNSEYSSAVYTCHLHTWALTLLKCKASLGELILQQETLCSNQSTKTGENINMTVRTNASLMTVDFHRLSTRVHWAPRGWELTWYPWQWSREWQHSLHCCQVMHQRKHCPTLCRNRPSVEVRLAQVCSRWSTTPYPVRTETITRSSARYVQRGEGKQCRQVWTNTRGVFKSRATPMARSTQLLPYHEPSVSLYCFLYVLCWFSAHFCKSNFKPFVQREQRGELFLWALTCVLSTPCPLLGFRDFMQQTHSVLTHRHGWHWDASIFSLNDIISQHHWAVPWDVGQGADREAEQGEV